MLILRMLSSNQRARKTMTTEEDNEAKEEEAKSLEQHRKIYSSRCMRFID